MEQKSIHQYKQFIRKKYKVILILVILILIMSLICLQIGSSNLGFIKTFKALFRIGEEKNKVILWNIRIPIVLCALVCGASLALSGCIMQNILQNPMASPTTLGVSNGAVFGANFAIIVLQAGMVSTSQGVSVSIHHPYVTTICAFIFSILSAVFILLLSKKQKFQSETIVLAGVAIGSLFTALTTIMQYFADDTKLASAVFWSFGSLENASYLEIGIMFVILVISFIYFYFNRWNYNAMAQGEESAKSLGVPVERIRWVSLLLASLLCSVCVSFLGIIGFIGLLAPHSIKKFIGKDYRYYMIASMLTGSFILLVADALSRSLMNHISFPIGAITSLFGAPFFLILLFHQKGHCHL